MSYTGSFQKHWENRADYLGIQNFTVPHPPYLVSPSRHRLHGASDTHALVSPDQGSRRSRVGEKMPTAFRVP